MNKSLIIFAVLATAMSLQIVHVEEVSDPTDLEVEALSQAELDKHNYYRSLHGCSAIAFNNTLTNAAQKYAERLAYYDYFDHSRGASQSKPLYG